MRRWVADRCRLALRKVMPRLMAFAFFPTREEMDQIVGHAFRQFLTAINTPAPAADRPRQDATLH